MHQYVPKNTTGNRWVIADIHGCYQTFRKLLDEKIKLQKTDQLFLLGDYIDKGRHGAKVIDFILELQQKGNQVFPIRGNHEQDFLDAYRDYDTRTFELYVSKMGKNIGLTENGVPKQQYINFMNSLPYVIETVDFVFAHAAVKPNIDYSDKNYVLQQYNVELSAEELNGKTLIRGHQHTPLSTIKENVQIRNPVITLDNGCVYSGRKKKFDTTELGELLALNLNTFELIGIDNCD